MAAFKDFSASDAAGVAPKKKPAPKKAPKQDAAPAAPQPKKESPPQQQAPQPKPKQPTGKRAAALVCGFLISVQVSQLILQRLAPSQQT